MAQNIHNIYSVEQLSEHLYAVGQVGGIQVVDCVMYLVVGEESFLAVDAGSGASFPFVLAAAARYGFAHKPCRYVLLTHEHYDHALGLPRFRELGAVAACSRLTADGLRPHFDPDRDVLLEREGTYELGEFTPEVVFTPGHSPSSTSYRMRVDGEVCLFSGDAILDDGDLVGSGRSEGSSSADLLASLRKLAALPPADRFLAGHRVALFLSSDPSAVLARAIAKGEAGLWELDYTERKRQLIAEYTAALEAARPFFA